MYIALRGEGKPGLMVDLREPMNQDSHSDEKQERLKEKLRDELGPVIVGLLDRSSGLEDILVNEDSRIWVKRTGSPSSRLASFPAARREGQ
jgi:Flp pilus assembly CpaF family ATPase